MDINLANISPLVLRFVVVTVLCMYALCGVLLCVCMFLPRRNSDGRLVEYKLKQPIN